MKAEMTLSLRSLGQIISKASSRVFSLANVYSKSTHLKIVGRDLFRLKSGIFSDVFHLRAAMEWLCRAQDITVCGGVSGGYSLEDGWLPPYPETTGYIIPTFLQYGLLNNDAHYLGRAVEMGDWEIEIQHPSGAVRGGMGIKEYPIVFNTGQVILGWASLYRETKKNKYLEAAVRAADWLLSVQDEDGKWSKYTYLGIPHAYHTRVAWPILEVHQLTGEKKYKTAAEKQIAWVLSQASENSWFNYMGFSLEEKPFLHTIAYTLRGLIESSVYLEEETRARILSRVQQASEKIMRRYELRKKDPYSMPLYLQATFDEKWKSKDNYSCLTGNSQIAIVWLRLYKLNNDARLLNAALKLIDQVKATQNFDSTNMGIQGGIAGSYPLWGGYMPFVYPNWSAKFFADAIMLQESAISELEKSNL